MSITRKKRFQHVRAVLLPVVVLLAALAWVVFDAVRLRSTELSKYSLPADHRATAMLDFMRKMDGSVRFADSYFESSNTAQVCAAIKEAYTLLQLDVRSLTTSQKREADYYHVYFRAAAMMQADREPSAEEIHLFLEEAKLYIEHANQFSKTETQIATISVQVLELLGRFKEAEEMAQFVRGEIDRRPELAGEAATAIANQLSRKIDRLQLPNQQLSLQSSTLDDQPFDLAKLRGKVVLVEFWGTNCKPCLADFAPLKRIYSKYHQRGFEIIGISLHAPPARIANFVEQYQLPWIQLCHDMAASGDCNEALAVRFGIDAVPTTFLVDQDNRVVAMGVRPLLADEHHDLEKWLAKLLPN